MNLPERPRTIYDHRVAVEATRTAGDGSMTATKDPKQWAIERMHMLEALSPVDIVESWEEHRKRVSYKGNQTWLGSLIEAKANIAVGIGVAYISNLLVLPLFGFTNLNPINNLYITAIYTLISVIRQLIVRRFFNNLKFGHHKS